mmetsp:Transcript_38429/g.42498  ORF Transcript_38429/g.42498 Transcript_38429/m.42498 type:complete len:453 (+) Transcript_38429:38-1396(+)
MFFSEGAYGNSWQRRVLLSISPTLEKKEENDSTIAAANYYDNISNPSYSPFCPQLEEYHCDSSNDGFLMVALRWARVLILKIGRMYYGAPLCLMLLPLAMGLLVGYRIGLYSKNKPAAREKKQTMVKEEGQQNNNENCSNNNFWSVSKSTALNNIYFFVSVFSQWLFSQSYFAMGSASALMNEEKEARFRHELFSNDEKTFVTKEMGKNNDSNPNHIAVIMDGNRRYGREVYPDNPLQGHVDGSQTLLKFIQWCLEVDSIQILTVYAFSTENWNRPASEVATLMTILNQYSEELRIEALKRRIRIHVQSTDKSRIPANVQASLDRMVNDTSQFRECGDPSKIPSLILNICLSYGGRDELVNACRQIASRVKFGKIEVDEIDRKTVEDALLIPDNPDLVIRTSGEIRLSNFLLWQSAYSEWYFLPIQWPALKREDFLAVLNNYVQQRKRRFGK